MKLEKLMQDLVVERDRIDAVIAFLRTRTETPKTAEKMLKTWKSNGALQHKNPPAKPHWTQTPAGRKRVSEINKKRWHPKRSRFSPAARAKLRAITLKRWQEAKKAGKATL